LDLEASSSVFDFERNAKGEKFFWLMLLECRGLFLYKLPQG
jgi:hypothetical protein